MGDYPGYDFSGYTFNDRGQTALSNFDGCNMRAATGAGINFVNSTFRDADMTSCDMSEANMSACDFCNATLDGGSFTSTNLSTRPTN